MSKPNNKPEPETEPATAGQFLMYALGCYGAAIGLFLLFYFLEQSQSGGMMPAWMAFLYKLGGKWLVAGIFGALGTLCLVGAIKTWLDDSK
jgi:hypothetical protein